MKHIKFIFLILSCLNYIYTDLPVHCLAGQIEGDWLIHMSDNHSDSDIKCGHKNPDQNLDHYNINVEEAFKIKYEVIIHLERPNVITSVVNNAEIGKWTMIYDEGYEAVFGNNIFFAFSRYEKIGKFNPSNTDTEDTPGYRNICEKTFEGSFCFKLGWYHDRDNKNWGCYWAEKINVRDYDVSSLDYNNIFKNQRVVKRQSVSYGSNLMTVNQNNKNAVKNNPEQPQENNFIKMMNSYAVNNVNNGNNGNNGNTTDKQNCSDNTNTALPFESTSTSTNFVDFIKSLGWGSNNPNSNYSNIPHLDIFFTNNENKDPQNFLEVETKTFAPDMEFVDRVNNPKSSYKWSAKVYDDFIGKSYDQMRHLLGNKSYYRNFVPNNNSDDKTFLELSVDVSLKAKSKKSSLFNKLPDSFDWRNVDNVNYDSPIRKQGECGSCYAIAAVGVLEARIRIRTNNRIKPILSPSSIVSCSRYNQGCAGGYPFLVGKHAKEFGFVEESCHPYAEVDDKCFNYCFHQKLYKAKDYGYVGGFYGACEEDAMMREIYENGPIVVAINATPELYYYSNGIFHSEAKKTEGKFEKNVKPWEYTNHAVVCIGWGEEMVKDNLVKYWILKNSWGDAWGEKGYFKLERGVDMASVEAQAVFIEPDI
jgi:C1A family cysteine protease